MDDPGSIPLGSIIIYFLFVFASALFSGTETSFVTVNRIHMMSQADKGNRSASRVLYILDNFEEALSAILIGNNIVNIGCATLSVVIATKIWGGGSATVSLATIITTVIIYVFGEVLPKCFARSHNEGFAMTVSAPMIFLMRVLKPLSAFFTWISKSVTKPFINRAEPELTMTQDELHDIVDNISEDDGFDEDTGKLVKSALAFDAVTAAEIMVPWNEVMTVSTGMKTDKILSEVRQSVHSRLPVVGRDGSVRGILQIRRFLRAYIKNRHVVLASVTDYPYFAKPDVMVDDLLAEMSNRRKSLAVIKNPDGAVLGIVTIEDILEQLVGEIYDEEDIGGGSDE